MAEPTTQADQHTKHVGHIVPMWLLVVVLLALLVLTFITVVSVWVIDLGPAGNLLMALAIATIKGVLVGLYFMHLRHEKPIVAIILIVSLLFLGLFVGLTLLDSLHHHHDVEAWRAGDPVRYAPEAFENP